MRRRETKRPYLERKPHNKYGSVIDDPAVGSVAVKMKGARETYAGGGFAEITVKSLMATRRDGEGIAGSGLEKSPPEIFFFRFSHRREIFRILCDL